MTVTLAYREIVALVSAVDARLAEAHAQGDDRDLQEIAHLAALLVKLGRARDALHGLPSYGLATATLHVEDQPVATQ